MKIYHGIVSHKGTKDTTLKTANAKSFVTLVPSCEIQREG